MSGFDVLADYNTYVWMAQLFIVGLAVGHLKDQLHFIRGETPLCFNRPTPCRFTPWLPHEFINELRIKIPDGTLYSKYYRMAPVEMQGRCESMTME